MRRFVVDACGVPYVVEAAGMTVNEGGSLILVGEDDVPVAIYATGQWRRAELFTETPAPMDDMFSSATREVARS